MVPPSAPERHLVHLGKDVAEVARKFSDALAASPLFRRDGKAVVVDPDAHALRPLDPVDFMTRVQRDCLTYRTKQRPRNAAGKEDKDADPVPVEETMSEKMSRAVLKNEDFLLALRRVCRVNPTTLPVVRPNGKLELLKPGYDKQQEAWTVANGVTVKKDADPETSQAFLRSLLEEFPWSDAHGRSMSCQLAAMLTPFVANMLNSEANRPAFVYTANTPGSGKTLLAQMAIISTVGTAAGITMPRTEDALVQVLNSAALSASPYLFFDNCEKMINPPQLSAFMTTKDWEVRLMHAQQLVSSKNEATIFLTGNDFVVGDDLWRRSFFIDMFCEEVDQEDRAIARPIDAAWLKNRENRGAVLSALWGLIRKWDADGRPAECGKRRSFEEWSRVVGGILTANGFCDPHEAPELMNSGNREKADVQRLVEACMGDQVGEVVEYHFGALMTLCRREGLFDWLLPPLDNEESLDAPRDATERDDDSAINEDIKQGTRTTLAKIFRKWCQGGRKYVTPRGACLFGARGKKRHSRYQFQKLDG